MSIDIIRISIENYSDFSVTYDVLLLLPGFCQYGRQKLHKDAKMFVMYGQRPI